MIYPEAIDWLFSTQMFGIKLGLDGPRRLLKEYLAHPAHGVTVIHVAGTNGKGSTCAMIDSIARSSGKRTGLFTSPHLIDYRERIKVSGVEIPEEDCASGLTELRAICERFDHHPTFFEITLALAMRWFRERECEVIVLETGMGGRLDATTAVQADIAVITPIGLDHTQWLGDTLELVAAEKAGIFVPGKPAVSSPQDPAAQAVLLLFCATGIYLQVATGRMWVRAAERQDAVVAAVLAAAGDLRAGDTVLIYGLCPYLGPAAVLRSPDDTGPRLMIASSGRILAADLIQPDTRLTSSEINTNHHDRLKGHYPYRSLVVVDLPRRAATRIESYSEASAFFAAHPIRDAAGCSYVRGRGTPLY